MTRARTRRRRRKRTTRRLRLTVPASCGRRRAATNRRSFSVPTCSARAKQNANAGSTNKPQSQIGCPKLIVSPPTPVRPHLPGETRPGPHADPRTRRRMSFFCEMTPSRQFFPNGLRQQQLGEQKSRARHQTSRKQIAVLLIFLHRDSRLLHLVDVAIDVLERVGVSRAEELAAGN